MKKKKQRLALWLMGVLLISMLPVQKMAPSIAAEMSDAEQTVSVGYGLKNPRIDNGVTTWDCIYFGNYPQSEYSPMQTPDDPVSGETYTDTDGTKMVYKEWKKVETVDGETIVLDCPPDYSKVEPIKWRVLSVEGDDAFLLADQNLDCQQYSTASGGVTWETCTMRSWLNGYGATENSPGKDYSGTGFLNYAFTEAERQAIETMTVENARNPVYDTDGGNNTEDLVYLLSYDELNNPAYGFESSQTTSTRAAETTEYARKGGEIQSPNVAWPTAYWTRSPGQNADRVCIVVGGTIAHPYNATYTQILVRPVLHLNLADSQGSWSKADSVTEGTPAVTASPSSVPTTEPVYTPAVTASPSSVPTTEPTYTPAVTASPSSVPTIEPVYTPNPTTASPTAAPAWLKPDIVYDAAELEAFAGRTKEEAEKKYAEAKYAAPEYKETNSTSFYDIQPSFAAPYHPGKLSRDSLKAMISLCNYYRWLVGAEEARGDTEQTIYVESEWNKFQHQAFMWSFLTKPEDFPEEKWARPDTAYYEFQQGTTPLEAIRNAVNTQCTSWDRNTYYAYSLRRDIISPGNGDVWLRMGYCGNWLSEQRAEGPVDDSSDNRPPFYSYPSEGYMPNDLIDVNDTAWSVMVNQKYLTIPSGNDISITVRHQESGEIFERSMEAGNAYACQDGILFEEPAEEEMSVYHGTYDVEVAGLLDVATGKGAKLCYTVTFFEASDIPPSEIDPDGSSSDESNAGESNIGGNDTGRDNTGENPTSDVQTQNSISEEERKDQEKEDDNISEEADTAADEKTMRPKLPKIKKVKVKAVKKGFVLTWKKVSGVSGYEIQVSTKKNFKGAKKLFRKKDHKKYKNSGLKAGKKYYIRIRAYKSWQTNTGKMKKVFGKWTVKKGRTL